MPPLNLIKECLTTNNSQFVDFLYHAKLVKSLKSKILCCTIKEHGYTLHNKKLILSFSIILFLLVSACQPASTPSPETSPTATRKATSTQSPPTATPGPTTPVHLQLTSSDLVGTKLVFWHPWTGELENVINDLVVEFNRSNDYGIRVTATSLGSESNLFDTVSTALEDGDTPQIVAAAADQLNAWHQDFGFVIDLEPYMDHPEWGLSEKQIADIPRVYLDQDNIDGAQLGIPALRDGHVLFYNQSWAEELGFNGPPTTPKEFKEQICTAYEANSSDDTRENDGTGGYIINTDAETILSWLSTFGSEPIPDNNEQRYTFNNPASTEALVYLREIFDEGCAWISRLPEPYDYFATRHALIYSGRLSDIPDQKYAFEWNKNNDIWTIQPYPVDEIKPVLLVSGQSYGALAASPEEQLASWMFIRWMIESANQPDIIKTSNTFSLSTESLQQMGSFINRNPQWSQTQTWAAFAQPLPSLASWHIAHCILNDLGWQLYQKETVTYDDFILYLQQADNMIQEVREYQP